MLQFYNEGLLKMIPAVQNHHNLKFLKKEQCLEAISLKSFIGPRFQMRNTVESQDSDAYFISAYNGTSLVHVQLLMSRQGAGVTLSI